MATLVHDDLIDSAELRRGKPTVWAVYGEEAAKAAGDYLFARAFTLARLDGRPARCRAPGRRGALARSRRGVAASPGVPNGYLR